MKKQDIHISGDELMLLHEHCYWNYGGESDIYRIPQENENMLIKLFYNPISKQFFISEKAIKNKECKINILKDMTLPNKVQVFGHVSLDGEFIGYTLNEAMQFQEFGFNTFSPSQQIEFLKRLKKRLDLFHELGIVFGDLKSDNILSHDTNYKLGCFCDLDNMQIGEFTIDIMSEYVSSFLDKYGKVDENLDWYAFNLLTLQMLFGLDHNSFRPYPETKDMITHYNGKNEILNDMKHVSTDYVGNLLINDPSFYQEFDIPVYRK